MMFFLNEIDLYNCNYMMLSSRVEIKIFYDNDHKPMIYCLKCLDTCLKICSKDSLWICFEPFIPLLIVKKVRTLLLHLINLY